MNTDSGFRIQDSGAAEASVSGEAVPALDAGRWTLDAGRWTLDAGRWTLDVNIKISTRIAVKARSH